MLWNRPGCLAKEADKLTALCSEREIHVYTTAACREEPNIASQSPFLAVPLQGSICVSTGRYRPLSEIREVIARNRKVHENRKAEFGELSEAYSAMQSCMAWDTIYEPKKDRVVTPVSRLWNIGWGGCVLFCWDTYFAAYMAALDSRELAMANAIEITQEAVSDGFVPNFAADEGRKSFDRSQPPVGSLVVREVYRRYPERWFLELLFPQLLKWNTWFYENRQIELGLLAWGSNPYPVRFGSHWETAGVGDTYGAALESGLDNSPMYDDVPFDKDRCLLELADVGLTSLFVMDCSPCGCRTRTRFSTNVRIPRNTAGGYRRQTSMPC